MRFARVGSGLRAVAGSRLDLVLLVVLALGVWAVAGGPAAPVVGAVALVIAVAVIVHLRRRITDTRRMTGRRLRALEEVVAAQRAEIADLAGAVAEAADAARVERAELRGAIAVESDARAVVVDLAEDLRKRTGTIDRLLKSTRADSAETRSLVRSGLRVARRELDVVRARLPRPSALAPVDASTRAVPRLSVAVPGYDRPDELDRCLRSIVDEIESIGTDEVEVWITDDGSRDHRAAEIAHRYACAHDYIGFRANAENIGLERNLLESCRPCRGEFLWVMGNDDFLHPGALSVVLADLDGTHDVLLFAKTRVDREGERALGVSAGVIPTGLIDDERRSFPTLLDLARQTGLVSGLGFISTLVLRRAPFVSTAPDPYLGLTMYPQLGVLLESLALAPTLVHNHPIVFHRTQTAAEKLAEAVGRRDESFMAGGPERDSQWFGAGFAALLQRVVDRSGVEVEDLATLPERLFREDNMIAWLARNRDEGMRRGLELPEAVRVDAERLFAATGHAAPDSDDGRAP